MGRRQNWKRRPFVGASHVPRLNAGVFTRGAIVDFETLAYDDKGGWKNVVSILYPDGTRREIPLTEVTSHDMSRVITGDLDDRRTDRSPATG